MVLAATALRDRLEVGRRRRSTTRGPQGFSETLYAYTSQAQQQRLGVRRLHGLPPAQRHERTAPSGSPSPTSLGGLAMLGGRFVPLLAALAVAGSLAGKRVTPPGLGTLRTDTPTFGVVLVVGRPDRRPADLRPRPAPRTRGPGPHRPALLTCANSGPPRSPSSSSRSMLGLAYPLAMTGISQVALPGPRRRLDGQGRRQGRRLEAHRPGLLRDTGGRTPTATRSSCPTCATSRAGRR